MWKYYKRYNPSGSGLKGKVYGLFRVKGVHVERYPPGPQATRMESSRATAR